MFKTKPPKSLAAKFTPNYENLTYKELSVSGNATFVVLADKLSAQI